MTEPSTNRHYSHDVEFFRAFLDPYMKYSSGLYPTGEESLEEGILGMLDHLIEVGRVRSGARVLDIGNGWGCMLKRLRERFDVDYTGVNPSDGQLAYIRGEVDAEANIVHGTLGDALPQLSGTYDTIFMIGALCHIEEKERMLRNVAELLAEGGRLVIEDTWFLSEELYQAHRSRPETDFVQSTVFGYAHVTSLAWHLDAIRRAGLWQVAALDNSLDYMRTSDLWCERLAELDEGTYPLAKQAIVYMDVFRRGWGHTICNQVMVLEKLPPRRKARYAVP